MTKQIGAFRLVLTFLVGVLMALILGGMGVTFAESGDPASRNAKPGNYGEIYEFSKTEFEPTSANPPSRLLEYQIYPEDKQWFIRSIKQAQDGFPEVSYERSFANEKDARNELRVLVASANKLNLHRIDPLDSDENPETTPPTPLTVSTKPLWEVTQSWNWDWEVKYAEWVEKNVDENFFVKYNIPTDCADVAYSFRWIFARIHGLPMASRLRANGGYFSQATARSQWDQIPTHATWNKDKRFLKALAYVTTLTYTHTLLRDSYPIAINSQALFPGVHHLSISDSSGHTYFVYRTYPNSKFELPLRIIVSTVPRAIRKLYEGVYWNSAPPPKLKGGFLRFPWAVLQEATIPSEVPTWVLVTPKKMPHYSLEQYDPEFIKGHPSFAMAVMKRLNPKMDLVQWLKDGISVVSKTLEERKLVVEEGFAYCSSHKCDPGTSGYEDWSTPSRDQRLFEHFLQLDKLVATLSEGGTDIGPTWNEGLKSSVITLGDRSYTLKEARYLWRLRVFDADPRFSIESRWNFSPTSLANRLQLIMQALVKKRHELHLESKASYAIDELARQYATQGLLYCSLFSVTDCKAFQDSLNAKMVTLPHEKVSLHQVLESAHLWNALPHISIERRWGALPEGVNAQTWRGVGGAYYNKNSPWVTVQSQSPLNFDTLEAVESKSIYIHRESLKRVESPSHLDCPNYTLELQSSRFYCLNEKSKRLEVRDLETKEIQQFLDIPDLLDSTYLVSVGNGIIEVTGTTSVLWIDFRGSKPTVIRSFSSTTMRSISSYIRGTRVVLEDSKNVYVLNSLASLLTPQHFTWPASRSDLPTGLIFEDSNYWVFHTDRCEVGEGTSCERFATVAVPKSDTSRTFTLKFPKQAAYINFISGTPLIWINLKSSTEGEFNSSLMVFEGNESPRMLEEFGKGVYYFDQSLFEGGFVFSVQGPSSAFVRKRCIFNQGRLVCRGMKSQNTQLTSRREYWIEYDEGKRHSVVRSLLNEGSIEAPLISFWNSGDENTWVKLCHDSAFIECGFYRADYLMDPTQSNSLGGSQNPILTGSFVQSDQASNPIWQHAMDRPSLGLTLDGINIPEPQVAVQPITTPQTIYGEDNVSRGLLMGMMPYSFLMLSW